MAEKQEILSDDEFKIIFYYKKMRELLLFDYRRKLIEKNFDLRRIENGILETYRGIIE